MYYLTSIRKVTTLYAIGNRKLEKLAKICERIEEFWQMSSLCKMQTFNSNKIEYAQIMKNNCGIILKFLLLPFKLFINKPCVKLCQAQR